MLDLLVVLDRHLDVFRSSNADMSLARLLESSFKDFGWKCGLAKNCGAEVLATGNTLSYAGRVTSNINLFVSTQAFAMSIL